MGPKSWRARCSSANKKPDWLINSPVWWAKLAGMKFKAGKDGCRGMVACQLNVLWIAWGGFGGWGGFSFGPTGSTEIAEVPFTLNCRDPVNIHLFNNPESAARRAFWRRRGLRFPFDVLSLSDSLSGIFVDGIGDIFSLFFFIYLIQAQRFPAVRL